MTDVPLTKGISGHVVKTRKCYKTKNVYEDPRFFSASDVRSSMKTRDLMSVPLSGPEGSVIAVLEVSERLFDGIVF